MITSEQKVLAVLAHVSYLMAGIGFIFVPLGLMLWKKDDTFVHEHAKQALCLHVLVIICATLSFVLTMLLVGFFLLPLFFALALFWFFASIYACWKVVNGEYYEYPLIQWLVRRI
jgi:uncharacterized protein